jgi:1-acyl-sn-glycerol-3-phosphate acyltransferase
MIARIIFMFLGLKSKEVHNLPTRGAVIAAANHVSMWDPCGRRSFSAPVHFMAKAELYEKAWFSLVIPPRLNAFPVNRGSADRVAMRHSLHVLEDEQVLGIFPEGTRYNSSELKAHTGVAWIALKSGAPVVPIACVGTRRFIPWGWFGSLEVRIGKPMDLNENVTENNMCSSG